MWKTFEMEIWKPIENEKSRSSDEVAQTHADWSITASSKWLNSNPICFFSVISRLENLFDSRIWKKMEEVFVRKVHSYRPSREAIQDRDPRSAEISGLNK